MKYTHLTSLLCLFVAIFFLACSDAPEIAEPTCPPEKKIETKLAEAPPKPEETLACGVVAAGNSAASLLKPWLSPQEIHALAKACRPVFRLTRMRVGKPYKVATLDEDFHRFEYAIDSNRYLEVVRGKEGFQATIKAFTYDVKEVLVRGEVKGSLYAAMQEAGESSILAVRLGNLFGWEIDFVRDLRVGDTFSVLVEKRFTQGKFKGYGHILAAEFTNQGCTYDAFRMECSGKIGYYSRDGRNLKHAFLKSPVAFTRISSGYSLKRWHPILKKYRPHYGVDYAAPVGTPIHAIGNGTLRVVATNRGSGKHIFITHANGYQSGYLHMSRFARGMKRGKKVEQGQVIGYVGQTGLATGPHLCFRMKQWGKPINPVKVKVTREKSIPDSEKEAFARLVAKLRPLLHAGIAANTPEVKEIENKG